jgi:uncharacterized protein
VNLSKANELQRKHRLHFGESEVVALALEISPESVLIDDRRAVHIARGFGLNVLPTPAIYAVAKRMGFIRNVRDKLDALRRVGFWLKDDDYFMILQTLGELSSLAQLVDRSR